MSSQTSFYSTGITLKRTNSAFAKKTSSLLSEEVLKTKKVEFTDSNQKMLTYLNTIITLEAKLEKLRNDASIRPDIYLNDVFAIFDPFGNGSISKRDFVAGLSRLDIITSTAEVDKVFKRYNLEGNGSFKLFFKKLF